MAEAGLEGLETQLGAAVPPRVAQLPAAQLQDLTAAIAEARHRQSAELDAAGDRALRHIPRLLRIAIRKVVG